MASSSTTSFHKNFKYDIFLSFRGEDTRTNFIDHLYYALKQKNIYTYKDDEAINKGKFISDELIRSIEDSQFYIIVFSKNYASSSWCLDELVKIIECHKTSDHTAFPVFYDVEPTEVRKQTGAVGEAFAKHKNNEAVGIWKQALKEAADLAGWELKNTANGFEANFIQKIIEGISLELRSINFSFDEKLVGMDLRVKSVISYLETGAIDDVRMIGIKGMGGGGKTTLARAVFDQISFQFEGKSFVENVREVTNSSLSGLKSLQNQVLSDILNNRGIYVGSVYDGKIMMKRRMRGRKVLVVLDDVDHVDQLDALAGEPNWFKPGSRIIITTRDEQVLVAHRVKLIIDVNLLSYKEAFCLFSRYAFGRDIPIQGYEVLSRQVVDYARQAVDYAAGLPLTITVLGSFLCGKNESEWEDALKRLKSIPLEETLKKLELSYLGLEEDYKEIFLNIACILKGWRKELAIEALESCGFHATNGLRVLEQKSLITIYGTSDYGEFVGMHDHIEEMGRNIVRRSHPNNPHKHSRLWIDEEIKYILANDLGTKTTRYIQLKNANSEIFIKGLKKMKELRFLHISQDFRHSITGERIYDNDSQYLPNALQYLNWYKYPLWSLPNTFQGNNLVALRMPNSNITQLWEGGERKVLNKLKFLGLGCSNLTTLDLGLIPNLEVLSRERCLHLVQLHMLDKCLKLISINLSYSKLKTVDLLSAVNLELLDLTSCFDLVELRLPEDGCQQLISVKISGSKLTTVDLHSAVNLELLDLTSCCDLVELHLPADGCLKLISVQISYSYLKTIDLRSAVNLKLLHLNHSFALVELYMPGECVNLRLLTLGQSKLRTLDIGSTPNLENLDLNNCSDLEDLHMANTCQKLISLNISHSKLKTLDLGLTPSLKIFHLEGCHNLEELHVPIGCLKNLDHLVLSCVRFISFNFNKRYESLEVGPLAELHLNAKSLERCPLHPDNTSPKFQFRCFYTADASSISNLGTLISIGMCACTDLDTFSKGICGLTRLRKLTINGYLEAPRELDQLECLEELSLSATPMEQLPDNICTLKHLKILELQFCWHLEKLPEDLGRLECLKELYLSSAKIKRLPDTICMLKHLKSLILYRCSLLEKLPEDLGLVRRLVKLVLSFSKIKHLPDTICMLKDLKQLHLDDCSLLEKLPEDLDRLECLKYLNVVGTGISHLQQNICLLKGLRMFGSRELLQTCGFTSEIQTSKYGDSCFVDV